MSGQVIRYNYLFVCLLLFSSLWISAHADDEDEEPHDEPSIEEDFTKVTCGSAVKLLHKSNQEYRLHSHNIKWGSGSGQQSVTAFPGTDDANSLWGISEQYKTPLCLAGTPIKCGDIIRLRHVTTKKYLHSHLHNAPLSGRQEVSCFGENGSSDTGDNWRVECESGDFWLRTTPVTFTHIDTGKKLFSRSSDQFNNNNCRGCPIIGQLEVSCAMVSSSDRDAFWLADDGIFFPNRQN